MTGNSIINKRIFTEDTKKRLQADFNASTPFRYLIIDDFLDPTFARTLLTRFPSLDNMKTHYAGLNEKKAEDNDFIKKETAFTFLPDTLSSPACAASLAAIAGIAPFQTAQ